MLSILFGLIIPVTIAHILVLSIIFELMDIKVLFKKKLLCSFLSMLLYAFPIIALTIVLEPLVARLWIYRLFVTFNPLSGLLFYFIAKRIFNFSPTRASIVMSSHLMFDYLFRLIYLLLRDICTSFLDITVHTNGFFPLDYVFLTLCIILRIVLLLTLRAYLKKSRNYIKLPPNYVDQNVNFSVFKTFFAVSIIYVIFVLARTMLLSDVSSPITVSTAFVYSFLIANIVLYLFYTTSKLRGHLLEWEMQATGTYISSLLHTNQEFRAIKHDFNNILQGYGGYLSIKDYDGLEKYHKKLFATTKQAGQFLNVIEVLRPRIAVYSLLEKVLENAKKAKVSFSVNQICDVTDIVLDDADLCRVLSIVLDNAIEEAALSKDRQINLSFEQKDDRTIILAISNTTRGDVNTDKIFIDGYTTKSGHSGTGLSYILPILDTYEGCSLRANYHDNQFAMLIMLNAAKK